MDSFHGRRLCRLVLVSYSRLWFTRWSSIMSTAAVNLRRLLLDMYWISALQVAVLLVVFKLLVPLMFFISISGKQNCGLCWQGTNTRIGWCTSPHCHVQACEMLTSVARMLIHPLQTATNRFPMNQPAPWPRLRNEVAGLRNSAGETKTSPVICPVRERLTGHAPCPLLACAPYRTIGPTFN